MNNTDEFKFKHHCNEDLSGLNLMNSNLSSSIMAGSNFTGADLSNSNFKNVDLTGALNLVDGLYNNKELQNIIAEALIEHQYSIQRQIVINDYYELSDTDILKEKLKTVQRVIDSLARMKLLDLVVSRDNEGTFNIARPQTLKKIEINNNKILYIPASTLIINEKGAKKKKYIYRIDTQNADLHMPSFIYFSDELEIYISIKKVYSLCCKKYEPFKIVYDNCPLWDDKKRCFKNNDTTFFATVYKISKGDIHGTIIRDKENDGEGG